jgi:hypothetical protein
VTAQGHPRAIYQRAIERGNLLAAETVLRELGGPTLGELLELTIVIAQKAPHRHGRVAARWLLRRLEQADDATIEDAALAVGCLASLAGPHHAQAASSLRAMAEKATGRNGRRGDRSARCVQPRPVRCRGRGG